MTVRKLLLPASLKLPGFIFLLLGTILGMIRFRFGIKPALLNLKPFALYSSYLENKYLQFIGNNMSEEVVGILLLTGLFLLAFSADKSENDDSVQLRINALFIAIYAEFVFLILSFLFTYGFAFVYMLMVNMAFPLIAFIVVYRISHFLKKKKGKA